MADVRAAEIGDARPLAPIAEDLFLRFAEIGIVDRHVAAPPEADARGAADLRVGRDVEHRPVGAVHMLGHVFEKQHMAGKIGLERRADHVGEDGDVEGGRGRGVQARLERGGIAAREPGQGAHARRFAAVAADVAHHGAVKKVRKAEPVKAGENVAEVAVAEIRLVPRGGGKAGKHFLRNPARPVTAPRDPDRIEGRIVRRLQESGRPLAVGAREMVVDEEALRMDVELGVREVRRGEGVGALGVFRPDRGRRCDDRYAHVLPFEMQGGDQ